jgi:hypothetical protein
MDILIKVSTSFVRRHRLICVQNATRMSFQAHIVRKPGLSSNFPFWMLDEKSDVKSTRGQPNSA